MTSLESRLQKAEVCCVYIPPGVSQPYSNRVQTLHSGCKLPHDLVHVTFLIFLLLSYPLFIHLIFIECLLCAKDPLRHLDYSRINHHDPAQTCVLDQKAREYTTNSSIGSWRPLPLAVWDSRTSHILDFSTETGRNLRQAGKGKSS